VKPKKPCGRPSNKPPRWPEAELLLPSSLGWPVGHERGDELAATQHLQTAADLGQRTTLVDWHHRWNLAQARLKESAGEWDAALDLLDEAGEATLKPRFPPCNGRSRKARIYLKQARLDKAESWVWSGAFQRG